MQRFRQHLLARHSIALIALALACSLALDLFALDPQKAITQFQHRHWGAAEGVDKVWAVAQTTDGYIWCASGTRLLKFDGVQFAQWKAKPGQDHIPGDLDRVFSTRDGSLWVSSAAQLTRILGKNSTNYSAKQGMTCGHVIAMCEDRNGVVWAAGQEICVFTNGQWHSLGPECGLPKETIRSLIFDHENTLWAAFGNTKDPLGGRIAWLRQGDTHFTISTNHTKVAYQLAEAPDGKIWAAQPSRSVRAFTHTKTDIEFVSPEIAVGSMSALFDRDETFWITTIGDGLRRVRNTSVLGPEKIKQFDNGIDQFTQKDGLSSDYTLALFEDHEGNIWTGGSSGLDCFSESKITHYSSREGMPFDNDLMIQAMPDGSIWAASNPHGLLKIVPSEGTATNKSAYQFIKKVQLTPVMCFYADKSGELYASTSEGVFRLGTTDGNPTLFPKTDVLKRVNAMAQDAKGGLWFCDSERSFVRLQGDDVQTVQRAQPPPRGDYVCAACTDKSGNVWFGWATGEVSCREAGKFKQYRSPAGLIVPQQIRGIMEDAKGQMWFVGSVGIGQFHDDKFRFLTKDTGLPGEEFVAMLQDDEGSFWLAGIDGIFRINVDEMEKAFSSPFPKINAQHFGFDDGLRGFIRQRSPSYPGGGYPLATKSKDGKLWFSTSAGLAVIDPRHILRNQTPPPVHIQQIKVAGKAYETFDHLEFPTGSRNCEINYVALSFSNPARVQYKYKLEGYDPDWVDAGTRREAFYSNLKPRKYKFRLRACNNDGVWNEASETVEFAIAPTFVETSWFPISVLVALAAILFGLHRLRLARLSNLMNLQLETQRKERRRIAQELHDTLLQGFTGIGLKLDALANGLPESLKSTKEQLLKMLEQSDQYLTEARRAVWELRSSSLEKNGDLVKALSDTVDRLLENTEIESKFLVDGTPRKLAPAVEDNLLRICEEAVTNAVKHAGCTQVEVTLTFKAKEIRLRIFDNGCGFDPQGPEANKEGHFGLAGLHERVKNLNGHLSLKAQPGKGAELIIIVRA